MRGENVTTRRCYKCGIEKPLNEFYIRKTWGAGQRMGECKVCSTEIAAAWNRKNRLINKYGITEEIYRQMIKDQRGLCKICKRPPGKVRLSVDHDHKTEKVRGLLCGPCNVSLGYFEKYIGRFMEYLGFYWTDGGSEDLQDLVDRYEHEYA